MFAVVYQFGDACWGDPGNTGRIFVMVTEVKHKTI